MLEIDFFEGVLAAHRRAPEAAGPVWKTAVYQQIETQRDGAKALTVKRMCALGRYRMVALLGMGEVYRADDLKQFERRPK